MYFRQHWFFFDNLKQKDMARNRVLLKYIYFLVLFCYFYNLSSIYFFFAFIAVLDVRCYLFENKFVFTNVSSIINYWADSCSSIIDSECTDYQRNNQTAGRNLEPTYYASHLCTDTILYSITLSLLQISESVLGKKSQRNA